MNESLSALLELKQKATLPPVLKLEQKNLLNKRGKLKHRMTFLNRKAITAVVMILNRIFHGSGAVGELDERMIQSSHRFGLAASSPILSESSLAGGLWRAQTVRG